MKRFRKIAMTFIAITAMMVNVKAQSIYINVDGGYNFESERDVITTTVKSSSEENIYGSYGRGIGWGAGLGYMINEHVGGEVNFSMFFGPEYRASYSDASGASGTQTLKGSVMRLTPSIKITAGDKMKPYCKFGLVIGLNPKLEGTASYKYAGGSGLISEHISGGAPLGFMGALGLDEKLTGKISFCAEINFVSLRWAPDKNEWSIEQTEAGVHLNESGTTTFVDKLNSPVPESSVFHVYKEQLKSYMPFGSFGFKAGLKFSFGIKKAAK
jgi:hypothetical protein